MRDAFCRFVLCAAVGGVTGFGGNIQGTLGYGFAKLSPDVVEVINDSQIFGEFLRNHIVNRSDQISLSDQSVLEFEFEFGRDVGDLRQSKVVQQVSTRLIQYLEEDVGVRIVPRFFTPSTLKRAAEKLDEDWTSLSVRIVVLSTLAQAIRANLDHNAGTIKVARSLRAIVLARPILSYVRDERDEDFGESKNLRPSEIFSANVVTLLERIKGRGGQSLGSSWGLLPSLGVLITKILGLDVPADKKIVIVKSVYEDDDAENQFELRIDQRNPLLPRLQIKLVDAEGRRHSWIFDSRLHAGYRVTKNKPIELEVSFKSKSLIDEDSRERSSQKPFWLFVRREESEPSFTFCVKEVDSDSNEDVYSIERILATSDLRVVTR